MSERPKTPLDDNPLSELDEALSESYHLGPYGCVEKAINEHPDKSELILGAMAHPAPSSMTSRFLARHGIKMTQASISRHRRGDCKCRTQ